MTPSWKVAVYMSISCAILGVILMPFPALVLHGTHACFICWGAGFLATAVSFVLAVPAHGWLWALGANLLALVIYVLYVITFFYSPH